MLRGHGKIYGCNAIYRDHPDLIDVLTAVDHGIMHEIYHSGYAFKKPCYFRHWTKMPLNMYQSVVEGFISKQELEDLKQYDIVKENEKDNAEEFVVHGTTLTGMVTIIRNEKKHYPNKSKQQIMEKIHKNKIYISYINKDKDMSKDINECWTDYVDHGWACGATSGYIATKVENPNEIYLIGHDLSSDNGKVNNVYKGTQNYQPPEAGLTPAINWINQWYTLFEWNPNIKFYKVNKDLDDKPTNKKIDTWNKWEKDGRLSYITQAQLLDKINQI